MRRPRQDRWRGRFALGKHKSAGWLRNRTAQPTVQGRPDGFEARGQLQLAQPAVRQAMTQAGVIVIVPENARFSQAGLLGVTGAPERDVATWSLAFIPLLKIRLTRLPARSLIRPRGCAT